MKKGRYVSPTRLTAAREFRGITKKALAEKIGVKPMSISGYENGDWQPASDVLKQIAIELEFPLDWFYQDDISLVDPKAPTFRAQSRMSAVIRSQSSRTWDFAALVAQRLSSEYNLPKLTLPDLSKETPEVAARYLRDEWRLGNEPIPNMVRLLESRGIMVFWTNIESRCVDAFCHWADDVPIIVLNTNERSGERTRFNAAHELAHLVLHRTGQGGHIKTNEDCFDRRPDVHSDMKSSRDPEEREANNFASAFLMPQASWQMESPLQPLLECFLDLKPRWKVSIQAMIRRSYDLSLLSEWQYESAMTKIAINGWRLCEPNPIPMEQSLLHQKVFSLLKEQGVTLAKWAETFGLETEVIKALMPMAWTIEEEKQVEHPPLLQLIANR